MKRFFENIFSLVFVAVSVVGCSDNGAGEKTDTAHCQGRLAISGISSATVVSRAELDLAQVCPGLKVPAPAELKLTLTGKDIVELEATEGGELKEVGRFDYDATYPMLADYDKPALFPGKYTVTLEYGDPEAVGPEPYYKGEVQAAVEIAEDNYCRVPVTVRNAGVRVTATDNCRNYFSDARFKLVIDGKESEYVFTLGAEDRPIFVPAGMKVGVKGSVRRPSQTSADDSEGEQLDIEVPARVTVAGTLHTFAFTAEAGGAGLKVEFLDPEEGGSFDEELNDGA